MENTETAPPPLRLVRVPRSEKPHLRRLLTDYLEEFVRLEKVPPRRDPDGHVLYRYFDDYWRESGRVPFALCLGKQMIGFCFLRDLDTRWQIAEFYVVPAYRRRGIGGRAVSLVKAYCRNDGRHRFLEADTQAFNLAARAFWESQGFVTTNDTGVEQENLLDLRAEAAPTDT